MSLEASLKFDSWVKFALHFDPISGFQHCGNKQSEQTFVMALAL